MPYRDENGHFISKEEAESRGILPTGEGEAAEEGGEAEDTEPEAPRPWAEEQREQTQAIFVDTGRGQTVEVPAGSPFEETLNRLADEANYGGFFRIFLNGSEVVNPGDSPQTIEPGQRIAITSYDKVGAA